MREAIPVPVPFGPVVTSFVNDHSAAIDRLKALIQQALGLSPDVMSIFDDTKRNMPDSVSTGDSVAAWLTMYSLNRAPIDLDLGDRPLVRRMVQFGVHCQLYGLAGAMTLAAAARWRSEPDQLLLVQRAITEGAALASEPDPSAAARQGYVAWCVAGLTDYLNPGSTATEEARSELRKVVDGLDASFGIERG
jgi:hypothetical protein